MSGSPIMRHKLFRDIRRQLAQFLAVAVTVLLGVALFGSAYDAYRNLLDSYNRVFDELQVADIWVTGGDTGSISTEVGAMDGVEAVAARAQVDVPLRVGERKLSGRVVGLAGDPVLNDVYLLEGERPTTGGNPMVLAEDHLAGEFDLAPGETVEVLLGETWTPVEVTGRASSGEYLWLARSRQDVFAFPDEFGVLFTPEAIAENLTGVEPNQVLVRVAGRSVDDVAAEVREVAREHGAVDLYTRAEQPSNSVLSEDIQGFSQMALLFPLLFLTAAGMAAYTLLSRRIHAERSVIGMLRAQGVRRRVILRHYLGYGLIAALAGAIPGVLLGLWLARLLTDFYLDFLSIPITAISFHPETPVLGISFALVAGSLAALAPARAAAAVPPAEAMRGVVPLSGGRRSLVERVLPFSSRLSASSRLVLRSISRNRRRTAMTIGGVVLSLLLILVSWSMLDTVLGNLDRQFGELDSSDAQIVFADAATPEDIESVTALDGVAVAEPQAVYPVSISGPDGSYSTVLRAVAEDTELRTFDVTSGRRPDPGEPAVMVGEALSGELGIEVGDTVRMTATDDLGNVVASRSVPVVGFVREALGTYAYTTLSGLAAALDAPRAPMNAALIRFEPDADGEAVRQAVEDVDGVAEYRATDSIRGLIDDATALLVGFVTLMLVVGGVMAATMLFTTASVSIAERSNEVATLRSSGVRLGRIAGLITAENLTVTVLGVVPGMIAGVLGGRAMMSTYVSDQFSFDFIVEPLTLAASAGAVLLVALLSQLPGLGALRRLDLAQTVRERSA